MERPEPDPIAQILQMECPEARALAMRQSGFPFFSKPNPRLMSGGGIQAAINRGIAGEPE
jgi:hypothetical protein